MVFCLFACCIPVRGSKRAIIYDFSREYWVHIPNSLAEIITQYQGKSKTEIYALYDSKDHEVLDSYFHFLEVHEFIFYIPRKEKKRFPPISTEWDYPAKISNAILDIGSYDLGNALAQLTNLGCGYIQIRQSEFDQVLDWSTILQTTAETAIFSIDLYIPFTQYDRETMEIWLSKHKRIQNIYIYGSPKHSIEHIRGRTYGNLIYVMQSLLSSVYIQDPAYFTVTTSLFIESLHYNNYLNRKIYIDFEGNIRNAPEQEHTFGNVNKDNIADIVDTKSFKCFWEIHKDVILVCRDCEYRYMCVDNRIPLKEPDTEIWYFNSPCAYNPYIAKWKQDPGYLPADPKHQNI